MCALVGEGIMGSMLFRLMIITLVVTTVTRGASNLDTPIRSDFRIDNPSFLNPCAGHLPVDEVARQANVLVGFENTPDCWLGPMAVKAGAVSEILTGMSARQAFDHLMTLMPMYSWKEMEGVAVVRPRAAWDDPTDVLNLPAASFSAIDTPVNDALHMALQAVIPPVFYPHHDVPHFGRPIDVAVTVAFPGGTMLEALNAIVRAHQSAHWQLGYSGNMATVALESLVFTGGGVGAPVALPLARR
jgi:hypothetical protein